MDVLLNKIKKCSVTLSEEESDKVFDRLWNNMSKSFYKFEVEQYYKCDMDSAYCNFIKKDYSGLITSLKKFNNNWGKTVKEKHNIKFKRLHIINIPLTDYLKYELYFYLINEKSGEKIKCIDTKSLKTDLNKLIDFIIFDEENIIINEHKNNGEYVCSYLYNSDVSVIKELVNEYNTIFEKAKDYKEYADFNQTIINTMKNINII